MTTFMKSAKKMVKYFSTAPTKLALVVRTDLKMTRGKIAAQCAHAAVMCVLDAQNGEQNEQQLLGAWFITGQPKIVLKVDGYKELIKLQEDCSKIGVGTSLVHDAGRTQLAAGTTTVLGIGPNTDEKINKLVGHLKLL